MDQPDAISYLSSLLGRQLRITTVDSRMFVGEFKCTDNECNIILAGTFEYRQPTPQAVSAAVNSLAAASKDNHTVDAASPGPAKLRVDMSCRCMGLVVVPGQYITKIELEQSFLA